MFRLFPFPCFALVTMPPVIPRMTFPMDTNMTAVESSESSARMSSAALCSSAEALYNDVEGAWTVS